MLKIKLVRTGKKNQPSYRIIVAKRRSKVNGKYVAQLGYYNPLTKPTTIKINQEAYQSWLNKGAQPTATVRKLAQKAFNGKTN